MPILYTTDCGKCRILAEALGYRNVQYEVNTDRQAMINLGMKTAPGLRVGDKLLDFKEAMDWAKTQGGIT